MWKRNLKYYYSIILLFVLFSCTHRENNVNTYEYKIDEISHQNITQPSFYTDTIKNKSFKNCNFSNDFGNNLLENSSFTNCNFEDVDEIRFDVKNISNVIFDKCKFNILRINNCSTLNLILIKNCKINEIIIDQSTFENIQITSETDTIKKITIQECFNSNNLTFSGNIKEINLEGGVIRYCDISKITNLDFKFNVYATYLKNPNFVNKRDKNYTILKSLNIDNAIFLPNTNSILKEELEWKKNNTNISANTKRSEIKQGFVTSKSVYNFLSKTFEINKQYKLADFFYYRSKVCETEISNTGLTKNILILFHEYFRGDYGTNFFKVLITFIIITFFFGFLYFAFGFFKFTFGYFINTKLFGVNLDNQKPILLTYRRNRAGLLVFIKHCFIFSVNNMVLGGFSDGFHLYNFTTLYLFPPRKYGSIGIGKFLSIIQSILGLLLVFFFLTAFLRLNR